MTSSMRLVFSEFDEVEDGDFGVVALDDVALRGGGDAADVMLLEVLHQSVGEDHFAHDSGR